MTAYIIKNAAGKLIGNDEPTSRGAKAYIKRLEKLHGELTIEPLPEGMIVLFNYATHELELVKA